MMPNQMPGAMPQAQWQPQQRTPSLAYLASGAYDKPPITARGVAPASLPPAIQKFVLPNPQALGVPTNLNLPQPKAVDWNQLQARMERLGVLRYEKARAEKGTLQVTMLFPTNDPTKGLPISAQADTEAEAVVMILNYAEELARKR